MKICYSGIVRIDCDVADWSWFTLEFDHDCGSNFQIEGTGEADIDPKGANYVACLSPLPAWSARRLDSPTTVEIMMLPVPDSPRPAGYVSSCSFLDPSAAETYIVIMGSRVNESNAHLQFVVLPQHFGDAVFRIVLPSSEKNRQID